MAQSLVKLTLESNQYERNLRQAQKSWNDFTKGIGLSAGKFTAVSVAIGAVTGALKVAKDAFFKNEQQLDSWGKAVDSARSLYDGFLNSLNTGNINGFLSNIDRITEAARAAYDALDNLGTFNAFNQINTQRTRTGLAEAIAGYRLGETSKESVQAAAAAYKTELEARQEREREAYSQAVRKIAAERGVPWGNLEQALSGSYGDYEKLKNVMPTGQRMVSYGAGMFGSGSYIEAMPVTEAEKMGQALRQLNDTELQNLQALGAQAERTGEEIAQIDKQMARVLNGKQTGASKGGGGKGGGATVQSFAPDSIAAQEELVKQLTNAWRNAAGSVRDEYLPQIAAAKSQLESMQMGPQKSLSPVNTKGVTFAGGIPGIGEGLTNLPQILSPLQQLNEEMERTQNLMMLAPDSDVYTTLKEHLEELIQKEKEFKKEGFDKQGENASVSWQNASQAISAVGSALTTIEDPAAKVLGLIAQAIASVAAGAGQAISAKDTTASGWAWIGAAAAITAQMVAIIATIHSATGYAQGGVIPGNSFSGDNQWARVNAGETILTRADAGVLASQLNGVGLQNLRLDTYVDGKALRIVLNNESRSRGRGSYVTSTTQIG